MRHDEESPGMPEVTVQWVHSGCHTGFLDVGVLETRQQYFLGSSPYRGLGRFGRGAGIPWNR